MVFVVPRSTLPPTPRSTEWLLLALLSLLWGGSFFFIKLALHDFQPLTIVAGRVSCAAIVLLTFVHLRGEKMPVSPKIWLSFAGMGLLNNLIPFSLIAWGQTHIDSSLAAILNATTPLFTVLLASLTKTEHLTWNRFLGVVLGFCGVIVLIGMETLSAISLKNLGQFAVLGAACSYAIAGVYGRRFKDLLPTVTATGMLTCTAIVMLPLALVIERPWSVHPGNATWLAMLGLSILSTAIAYLIYFHLLAVVGATNLSLVTFLIPISALLLGVGILHEQPQETALIGMMLILAGLATINRPLLRRPKRPLA